MTIERKTVMKNSLGESPVRRETRRFCESVIGIAINWLERMKWRLEDNPSREQVVAWQRTVFWPLMDLPTGAICPGDAKIVNAQQIGGFFPEFEQALSCWLEHPGYEELERLKGVCSDLNIKLANVYGLPAVSRD